jgi:hypothetical protein
MKHEQEREKRDPESVHVCSHANMVRRGEKGGREREGELERERERERNRGRMKEKGGDLCSNSSNTDQLDKGLITTFTRKNNSLLLISMFTNYTVCMQSCSVFESEQRLLVHVHGENLD